MVEHAQQHDEFVQLLGQYQDRIYGYIVAMVHNFADADDLFQLTSMVIWRKFHEYNPESSFVRWSCGIARIEVLNFLKSKNRRPLLLSEDLQLEMAAIQAESDASTIEKRKSALAQCLEKLSKQNRRLLELCYGGEGTIDEASTQTGRSKHSIYNSLRRIRASLQMCVHREIVREVRG